MVGWWLESRLGSSGKTLKERFLIRSRTWAEANGPGAVLGIRLKHHISPTETTWRGTKQMTVQKCDLSSIIFPSSFTMTSQVYFDQNGAAGRPRSDRVTSGTTPKTYLDTTLLYLTVSHGNPFEKIDGISIWCYLTVTHVKTRWIFYPTLSDAIWRLVPRESHVSRDREGPIRRYLTLSDGSSFQMMVTPCIWCYLTLSDGSFLFSKWW